ncbi:hypothetical protein EJP77_06160 [Paenibacillus zeisoli]|uniref:Uncharacterized protein n=1 Tax=Paenibacillus zeisoli TaxID=2496267 RepID=A0A433XGJ3_9BACL|nr:hypothetical protein [Paenibacillus zeisoli]RUT33237.1 hypothetical protein EJP77_06160 [Paenibacillus zeisoli]
MTPICLPHQSSSETGSAALSLHHREGRHDLSAAYPKAAMIYLRPWGGQRREEEASPSRAPALIRGRMSHGGEMSELKKRKRSPLSTDFNPEQG